MENGAAQATSQGQNIDGTFHTKQVHTFLQVEGGITTLRWHTPLSRPFNLENYAKMKAQPAETCKTVENTLEDPRKNNGMEQRKPQAKVKHRWNFPQDRHTVWQVKRGR